MKYYESFLISPKESLTMRFSEIDYFMPMGLYRPFVWSVDCGGKNDLDPRDSLIIAKLFFLLYLKNCILHREVADRFFIFNQVTTVFFDLYWTANETDIGSILEPGAVARQLGAETLMGYASGIEIFDRFLKSHGLDIIDDES